MRLREYFEISEVFTYFFRKKDPNRPTNTSLKMMHGVNKLSILIFLVALSVMFYRYFIR